MAARGIDLPNLGLVIHADLPHDAEALQHRSGRTGRAGRKGISAVLVSRAKLRKAEHLFATAGVVPTWSAPPAAAAIRVRDAERLVADPMLTDDALDDDVETVGRLLAERSPTQLAAALVRLYRAQLPGVEEVADPGFQVQSTRERGERGERGEGGRSRRGDGHWFRLDVGRADRADPRRLLPMLCRRGNVSREDIGAIRIFDRETKVEIRPELAGHFAAAVRASEGAGGVRIERIAASPQRGAKPSHATEALTKPKVRPPKKRQRS